MGREAVVELLELDEPIREIIHSGNMIDLHRYLRETDFMSFRQAAIEKVFAGITSIDEVFRVLPRSALRVNSSRPERLPKVMA